MLYIQVQAQIGTHLRRRGCLSRPVFLPLLEAPQTRAAKTPGSRARTRLLCASALQRADGRSLRQWLTFFILLFCPFAILPFFSYHIDVPEASSFHISHPSFLRIADTSHAGEPPPEFASDARHPQSLSPQWPAGYVSVDVEIIPVVARTSVISWDSEECTGVGSDTGEAGEARTAIITRGAGAGAEEHGIQLQIARQPCGGVYKRHNPYRRGGEKLRGTGIHAA
ncbi:hypothetical protein B0H13DRAFT_2267959 [Mycena leptocephala]|nr:hypothetical protein B0H13DRAFT_2267959 [Mycena leptocephala]